MPWVLHVAGLALTPPNVRVTGSNARGRVHCQPSCFLVPCHPGTWRTRETLACCARSELAARLRSTDGGWQYTPTAQLSRILTRIYPVRRPFSIRMKLQCPIRPGGPRIH